MKWLKTLTEKAIKKPLIRYGAIILGVIALSGGSYAISRFFDKTDEEVIVAMANQKIEEQVPLYGLSYDDKVLGYVPDEASASIIFDLAYEALVERIGYDPEVSKDFLTIQSEELIETITPEKELLTTLEDTLFNRIEDLKVKACVMKIGDDFVVSVADEEAIKSVIEGAERLYLNDDAGVSVDLVTDEHNSMVMVPEVTIMQKELSEERIFVTAPGDGKPMEDLTADDSEFVESVVKEVLLEQQIVVVEAFVSTTEVKTIQEATQLITKEHEKEKTYEVESGDCPSIIAVENGMSTRELYNMNPGLEENANKMQIGDELVIMVPEPELFVTTVEDVIYTEVIDRNYTYVNNPDAYVGTNEVLEPGYDGVLEVRATICKVNGKETDREIHEQTIVLEPKKEKVLKGTKALPVTTATGTFDMPLTSYTFTSGYGPRWGTFHKGIDLAAPTGRSIKASDGGRIIKAGWNGGYGYMIEIDHGKGITSVYGHCSALYVSVGEEVAKYQNIGAVGSTGNSTGPHLHFEIRVNGSHRNPMNYLK